MGKAASRSIDIFAKSALALIAMNELRGLILAVPILYAMYQAGGTLMAIWLGMCSLGGIALSVAAPVFLVSIVGAQPSGQTTG